MKLLNVLTLSLSMAFLSGCAQTARKTYSGEPKDRSQIAVLIGGATEFARERYSTQFHDYAELDAGKKPTFNRVYDAFQTAPRELHMLPGRYLVRINCMVGGNRNAWLLISLEVAAGATYEIICEPVPSDLGKVRARSRRIEIQSQN